LERTSKSRPTGVTIIAILSIIVGVIALFIGISSVIAGSFLSSLPPSAFNEGNQTINGNLTSSGGIPLSGIQPSLFGSIAIAIGGVLIAIGIVYLVVAYGLLKGKRWAWTVSVIISIINIVLNAVSIAASAGANVGAIVIIIISGVILYYLYRPHVKAYFGKGINPSTPAA
jgi:hypothetical protein